MYKLYTGAFYLGAHWTKKKKPLSRGAEWLLCELLIFKGLQHS